MSELDNSDIVILGTGHGGAQAAIALRQHGFQGSITMVGREPDLPYERPPLSKEYLDGSRPFERLLLRPATFWETRGVALRLGTEVVGLDSDRKSVALSDGESLHYGKLIWAAGGTPRRLACGGADLAGVHTLRSRADVDDLRAAIAAGARKAVVVGGGYIGLEAAAVLRKLGCEVVLLEALPRVLARVAGPTISAFFADEHRARGVDLRFNCAIECIEGDGVRATGVRLSDGEIVPCDLVIAGIGIVPETGLLAAAGADVGNGVRVDEYCRTSLPDIYAIGDCAEHSNGFAGGAQVRLESVQNATDMAAVAARHISGEPEPYRALPWFWSNQYDLKLQTAGLSLGHDREVVRGDPAGRSFSVLYLKTGRVVAIDCVNSVRDYVQGTKLIHAGAAPPEELILDPNRALKDFLQ